MNRDVAKVKRLSVVLLLLGLAGCNYPSKEQAKKACEVWRRKGEIINYSVESTGRNISNRYCSNEDETNQYLGYQGEFTDYHRSKSNKVVSTYEDSYLKAENFKIVKHFRY